MKELCQIYEKQIRENIHHGWEPKPRKFEEDEFFEMLWCNISFAVQVEHILWMLEEIPKFNVDYNTIANDVTEYGSFSLNLDNLSKCYRWLGFVQGWMIKENICSVNFLKTTTREHVK